MAFIKLNRGDCKAQVYINVSKILHYGAQVNGNLSYVLLGNEENEIVVVIESLKQITQLIKEASSEIRSN